MKFAFQKAWPYLLLLALDIVFFWDSLFFGKVPYLRDTFCDLFPFRQYAASAFCNGAIPLWNNCSGFGKPFLADPIAGVFYPPHLLFCFFPATAAFKISYVLHFFIGGAGMYALMRRWRFSTGAGLLSAIAFMFNTWMLAWLEFFCSFNAVVWMPFVLLVAQRILEKELAPEASKSLWLRLRRNFPSAVLLGVLLAMQYFAGSPEIILYSLLVAMAFVTARCLLAGNVRAFCGCASAFAIAGVLSLCLVLPQLLLSAEFIKYSERSGAINPRLESASFHPGNLLTLLFPFLYGRPGYPQEFWAQSVYEFCLGTCYVGILPVLLALFSFSYWRGQKSEDERQKRFVAIFFFIVALTGFLMAAGRYTPLYMLVYHLVPIFQHFRWATKFLIWMTYGLCILAGVGYEAVFKQTATKNGECRWALPILAGCAVVFSILMLAYWLSEDPTGFFKMLTLGAYIPTPAHLQGVSSDFEAGLWFFALSLGALGLVLFTKIRGAWLHGMVIGLAFVNLFFISRQVQFNGKDDIYEYRPQTLARVLQSGPGAVHSIYTDAQQYLYGSQDVEVWRWAKEAALGATWLPFHIAHDWQGGLKLERHLQLLQALGTLPAEKAQHLADAMGLRYFIYGAPFPEILLGQAEKSVRFAERSTARPRAFLVEDWEAVGDVNHAIRTLADPTFPLAEKAVVEALQGGDVPPRHAKNDPANPAATKVLSVTDGWNRVAVEAESDGGRMLVLNEAWYPGWKARVDGAEQPVYRANGLFRGVLLSPGKHKVEFFYEPWQFRAGSLVSLATLLFVVVPAGVMGLVGMRRGRAVPSSSR